VRRHLNQLPLRIRLTLAFAGAAAVLLAAIGAFIFLRVKSGLDDELDHSLRLRAAELVQRAKDPRQLRAGLDAAGQPAQLMTRDGRVIVSTRVKRAKPLIGPVHLAAARRGEVVFEREENTRILSRPAGPRTIVAVAASMRQRERTLETLSGVLLVGLPIALLLASAAGYAVAAAALRPVERMRRHAAGISEATSEARLPLPDAEDEVHRLGETLNDMLGRIEAAARQEREFVGNASHELRTPLAILKAEIEVALQAESTPDDWHFALVSAAEETDRLARLAEDLLMIARGDENAPAADLEQLALRDFAERIAARFDARVEVAIDPGVRALAQPVALDRALTNLIDNALRYGAEPIEITAKARNNWIALHVIDQGVGFADDYLPRAFERFSRPTGARKGGAGLGLALVEAVAHTYGGEAGAANEPFGTDVWLTLPRTREVATAASVRQASLGARTTDA
jgi:two-component system OmpR family sensor kinase